MNQAGKDGDVRIDSTLGAKGALCVGYALMSAVDGIGVAVALLAVKYGFSSAVQGSIPPLVFVWFLLFSVPAGALCERFGRRRVAVGALAATAVAMFLPLSVPIGLSPACVYAATFALLGVANIALQVALPPLVASVSPPGSAAGRVMGCLAVKTAAAAAIPFLFAACERASGSWELAFPIAGAVAAATAFVLARVRMPQATGSASRPGFFGALGMLRDPVVAAVVFCFALGVCQDVWLNLAMPGMLCGYYGWAGARLGLGASVYFAAKIPAMAAGAVLLPRFRPWAFAAPGVAAVAVGVAVLCLAPPVPLFFAALLLVSFGSANFYGVAFGVLAAHRPDRLDALSALLVMSISSGALVAPVMSVLGGFD